MTAERVFEDTYEPVVVERFYDRELTGRQRALRILARIFRGFLLIMAMAAVLVPLQLVGIATLDLPLNLFDSLAPTEGLAASRWMSRGEGLLMIALLATLLMTRRWGARRVATAVSASWLITLVSLTMLIIEHAPELRAGDYPSVRFAGVLLASWIIAQLFAAEVYDLTRGGAWWRAPFYGSLFGFGLQGLIYFPGAFAGTGAPWPWWMAQNMLLMAMISGAFLLLYAPLRRLIKPRSGLGGR